MLLFSAAKITISLCVPIGVDIYTASKLYFLKAVFNEFSNGLSNFRFNNSPFSHISIYAKQQVH